MPTTVDTLAPLHEEMTGWRRDIHAHPELGFQEARTAGRVAALLQACGIEVTRGVGKTGVVGTLRAGSGGRASQRAIGLRADMDALPIAEANTFGHRSTHAGVMHACGHDGHTAMLLGAATHLARTRNFDGTVHFIFQPAEEGLGGAKAMIDDGLFRRFPCDSIFGMHNRPKLEVGRFAVRSGPMMAGGGFFDIRVTGRGSHGARPESGVDAALVAAQIAVSIQSIVARNVSPLDSAVVSVTRIHAGDAYNVIPQTAELGGTVRAFSRATLDAVAAHLKRVAEGTAAAYGATAEVDTRLIFAPTINNAQEAEFAARICTELVGEANVEREPPLIMASEDFSFMLEQVPGCYLNVGNGTGKDGDGSGCEVHNPAYDFNDRALPLGAAFFVRAVETKLAR
jgi:hippurate hydrolase